MMVIDQASAVQIGTIACPGQYRDGDIFHVISVSFDPFEVPDMSSWSKISAPLRLSLKVSTLRRCVEIDEIDLIMSNFGTIYDQNSILRIFVEICAQRRDEMTLAMLQDPAVQVSCEKNMASNSFTFSARLAVVATDLETSEQLFDMDQFTPA